MLLSAGFNLSFMDMIIKDAVKSVLCISTAYNKGVGIYIYGNIILPKFDIVLAFSESKF